MLINKDQSNPHTVRVVFDGGTGHVQSFSGPVTMSTFGSEQYVWQSDGIKSHADPENPPAVNTVKADPSTNFTLPKASVTVLRGGISLANK